VQHKARENSLLVYPFQDVSLSKQQALPDATTLQVLLSGVRVCSFRQSPSYAPKFAG
jgi:hypothetical protein